jgi:arogenate dehydrogenase (NADP+)
MMARYNQPALLHALAQYRNQLDRLIHQIENRNWEELEQSLIETQEGRSGFVE